MFVFMRTNIDRIWHLSSDIRQRIRVVILLNDEKFISAATTLPDRVHTIVRSIFINGNISSSHFNRVSKAESGKSQLVSAQCCLCHCISTFIFYFSSIATFLIISSTALNCFYVIFNWGSIYSRDLDMDTLGIKYI